MPSSKALRAGFLLAILFLAGCSTYVAFEELSYRSSAGRLGPGFMPRIYGVALVAMCVYSLVVDLRDHSLRLPVAPGWRAAAILALLSGVLVGLLELLGGLLSMIVFMAAALWFFNRGRTLQNVLMAILLPLAIFLVFRVWLGASLPRGLPGLPF